MVGSRKDFEFVTAATFKPDGAREARFRFSSPHRDTSFLEAMAEVF